jgi:type I restriction enzyme S subunit
LTNGPTIIVGRKGSVGQVQFSPKGCWPIDTTYFVDASCTDQDLRWLYHTLKALDLARLNKATGVPGLNRNDAYERPVVVPPLEHQRRIAKILDQANRVLDGRETTLALADGLSRSVFRSLIGSPLQNEKEWHSDYLGNHLSFVTSGSRGWAEFYCEAGPRFIRSYDVQMNGLRFPEPIFVNPPDNAERFRTRVQSGDVLLTITGSKIGRVSAVGPDLGEAYVSQHVAILRPKPSLDPVYLSWYLSDEAGGQVQIKRLQYGQTKPGLNLQQLKKFRVLVPPLDVQAMVVRALGTTESIRTILAAQAEESRQLGAALSGKAFRGDL